MKEKFQLAGYSVSELLEVYRCDLFEYYLPFLDQHVYDTEYGGFMCDTSRSGEQVSTHKRAWYDGRGVWVYSFLYRYFGQKEQYLIKASKTVEFLLSIKKPQYPFWPWGYTRTGVTLDGYKPDIYGSLFIAEGLAGYAYATQEKSYWFNAKDILIKCVTKYDEEGYEYMPHYATSGEIIRAPRVLGHWMVFLNLSRYLLEQQQDDELEHISNRCLDALMKRHLHPESNLLIENLNHDFSLPQPNHDQFAITGHGIEVLWMQMMEAERRGDEGLFDHAAELFKRHVEISWDDVYSGFFHELTNVNKNRWLLDKVLWVQEEVLIGLMILIEKKRDAWAIRWFNRVYPYVRQHFILHDHPNKLWINGGDRRIKEHHQMDRFENYHHPRHLMMNILTLEKMMVTL